MSDGYPATSAPKNNVLNIITNRKTKEITDINIPATDEIRSGAVVNDVIPSIARLINFK